ncbi:MAG TPA: biotin-dependent carboxyltransferase family protein [Chitinophagaceae bacterium]|nr:biotin-dependent carboxyltransferase family protein [Chitinophagaceae bacterium]
MSIRIIKAGVLDSFQDWGRYGYRHLGINPGGSMDKFSATTANMLVGNSPDEAIIEMHFPASVFLFEKPALIALAGADFSASINGESIPLLHAVAVNKNTILQLQQPLYGARVYLAIKGGFKIDQWLDSYSTHLKAMVGGFNGRSLRKDDQIFFQEINGLASLPGEKDFIILPWQADNNWNENSGEKLWILPGHEWEGLTQKSQDNFLNSSFTITNQSDRMGYRLNGSILEMKTNEELVSSAVSFGTIQLLPDGRLILLMADHQTTGGYPRTAHVITAHHSKAAQMKSGDQIYFHFTDLQTAESLLLKQQQHLLQLQNACKFKLESFLNA